MATSLHAMSVLYFILVIIQIKTNATACKLHVIFGISPDHTNANIRNILHVSEFPQNNKYLTLICCTLVRGHFFYSIVAYTSHPLKTVFKCET